MGVGMASCYVEREFGMVTNKWYGMVRYGTIFHSVRGFTGTSRSLAQAQVEVRG